MTDRFDDLLIKARAEMLGKHTLRAEPSTDAVFETVWDNMQKGFFDGIKRGYKGKRRMPGRSGQLNDEAYAMYLRSRQPKPKRTRGPRKPKAPAQPITDESRMLPEQSANQQSTQPESPREPLGLPAPREKTDPAIDLEEGKDYSISPSHEASHAQFEDIGAQGPWGGANTAPKNRQLPAPSQDVGSQEPPSAFDQGWNVSQRRDATNTADEWGNVEDQPSAPPEAEESKVGLPWSPTLTESGPGSRAEDWNTRNRSIWGKRSKKGQAMNAHYDSLNAPPEAELDERAAAEEQLNNLKPGQSMDMSVFDKPDEPDEGEAPAPNAPTDVASATKRAEGRKAKRESTPQTQTTLFDEPKIPKLEDLPGNPDVKGPLAEAAGGVPYGEYTKHIQNAMQGNEQSLQWFANNPDAVKQHGSGVLPKRIQDALNAMSGSGKIKSDKKKSHDAFNSAWSVLKDPFANPFDNPSAFATYDDFNMNKAQRLPSETEMNSIRGVGDALSRNPDPMPHHAGIPRTKDMDAYYAEQQAARDESKRHFEGVDKLNTMGIDEIQARLAANPEHEGDWRHLSAEGIDRASMAEVQQLMADINHESMHEAQPVEKQYQNADMSLLPAGLLKQMKGQQQASADYSLLPQGWQEEVA